jgi:RNA polymerase sigma factor (sigma-70 family)
MLECLPGPPADFCFLSPPSSGIERMMDRVPSEITTRGGRDELTLLLDSVAQGDRDAFSRLYERTAAKLYGICLRLMGNEAEAQEVLQEAYVTVWRKAARFEPAKASPITWLAVLARNTAIDRLRRRTAGLEDLDQAAEVADDRPSAFTLLAEAQDATRLYHCLETLDGRAQAMIRSAFLEGINYPQLAEREGVPLGTMKSWIRRGLQRLRACLEQ